MTTVWVEASVSASQDFPCAACSPPEAPNFMRIHLLAVLALLLSSTLGAAKDGKEVEPPTLAMSFLCGGETYLEDPRDQKPAEVGPGAPKACDPNLFAAISQAFENANTVYGVTPAFNPDVNCDSSECPVGEECDGYSWYTVKYDPPVVTFDPASGEWCVSMSAASYTGRGAGCTKCGEQLF